MELQVEKKLVSLRSLWQRLETRNMVFLFLSGTHTHYFVNLTEDSEAEQHWQYKSASRKYQMTISIVWL